MRYLLGLCVVVSCSDPGPSVLGYVDVKVSTNAGLGEVVIPSKPIANAYVLADGSSTVTDSDGHASVPVSQQSTTVHVITDNLIYTVNEVTPGSSIVLGGRPVGQTAGEQLIQLPPLSGATYKAFTETGCGSMSTSGALARFDYKAPCVNQTLQLFVVASDSVGTHTIATTFTVGPNMPVTVAGPYRDAVMIRAATTTLPVDTAVAGVIDPSTHDFTPASIMLSDPTQIAAAPEATDLYVHVQIDGDRKTSLFERGATTVDDSRFLGVAEVTNVAGGHVEWTFAGPRAATGSVLGTSIGSGIAWLIYSGPDRTSVDIPTLPADAPIKIDPSATVGNGTLVYYAIDDTDLTYTIDANLGRWQDGISMPEHSIAFSSRAF